MKGKPLFEDFPEVSAKAWKQKIQYELKGKDYNQEMVWDSPEGIKVKPFYHADDLSGLKTTNFRIDSWKIGQTIYAGNAIMANEKALKFLAKGAEAIQFVIPNEEVDVVSLLKNIDISSSDVYLEMQFLSKVYISNLLAKVAGSEKIHLQIDLIQ